MSITRDHDGFHRVQLPTLADELDAHEGRRQLSPEELTPFDQLPDDEPIESSRLRQVADLVIIPPQEGNIPMETTGLPVVTEKLCHGPCGRHRPVLEFGRHAKTADHLQGWCRDCKSAAARGVQPHQRGRSAVRVRSVDRTIVSVEVLREKRQKAYDAYLALDEQLKAAQAGLLDLKRRLEAALV